jgi:polyhydroxyalkanoate synthesis regulator phasin
VKDIFKRGIMVGLGAAELTREALNKAIADLQKKGEVSSTQAKKILDTLGKTVTKRRQDMEKAFEGAVSNVLNRMNIVTADQVRELEKKVKSLERKLKTKSGGKKK